MFYPCAPLNSFLKTFLTTFKGKYMPTKHALYKTKLLLCESVSYTLGGPEVRWYQSRLFQDLQTPQAWGYSYIFADLLWINAAVLKSGRRSFPVRHPLCVLPLLSSVAQASISWIPRTVCCGFLPRQLCPMISVPKRKSRFVFQSAGCFHYAARLLRVTAPSVFDRRHS